MSRREIRAYVLVIFIRLKFNVRLGKAVMGQDRHHDESGSNCVIRHCVGETG